MCKKADNSHCYPGQTSKPCSRWKSSASFGDVKRCILPLCTILILHGLYWNPRKVPRSANTFLAASNARRCRMVSVERSWAKNRRLPSYVIIRCLVDRKTNSRSWNCKNRMRTALSWFGFGGAKVR